MKHGKEIICENIVYVYDSGSHGFLIHDILKSGKIYIPASIIYKNNEYFVTGITSELYNKIYDKNITYFDVDKNSTYLCSIDGIIYFTAEHIYYNIYADKRPLNFAIAPPKLDMEELVLPDNYTNNLYLHRFCTAKKLKTIISNKNIHLEDYSISILCYLENIIIKDKHLTKINNKWIIKK